MATGTPCWPGMRPVKTCTECKQSKLRCDSKDRFPNPCSRCHTKNLSCTVDPSFRRTPARKRIEAMSKELQELRVQQGASVRATSTTSTDSCLSQDMPGTGAHSPMPPQMDDFVMNLESLEFGGVVVSTTSAIEAFQIIIAVVTSHTFVSSDDSLFQRIEAPFQAYVRHEVLQAPLPLYKIQALLFLCMWPLPVPTQPHDPSWLYCGIAINSAMYMSIHRPGPPPSLRSIGVVSGSAEMRARTWLGCFYVSTALSMHLGLPPMVSTPSELLTIRTFVSEHMVPPEFALQIRLQITMASYINALTHNSNDGNVDSSILQLLDGELDSMKASFPSGWTRMAEFSVLVAKMHVYALVITRNRAGLASRDILLKLALSASLRIVHIANERFHEDPNEVYNMSNPQRQRSLPKNYYRGIAFATAFLLRYFSLNNTASMEEQQLAANHVIMAHKIFKACSTHAKDEYGRVATLFETLCRQAPIPFDAHKLRLTDRMGVSILLDAISTASGLRGDPVEMPEPEFAIAPELQPAQPNMTQPDFFNAAVSQAIDPWPSDMAFTNEFWNDPMWDVFHLPMESAQFQVNHGSQ